MTDAQDGHSSLPAELSAVTGPLSGVGIGSQTANCSYTDTGRTHGHRVGCRIPSSTPAKPVIKLARASTPEVNANGWNNTDVTVEWSCTDAVSGVVVDHG